MPELDEVKWLQGLGAGDDYAFKILFEKYYASLCAFAANFVNDPDVAEDIVQEIFFKLYTDKPTFDAVIALKSYLYLVTKNQCLNYLKHVRIEQEYVSSMKERESTTFFLTRSWSRSYWHYCQKLYRIYRSRRDKYSNWYWRVSIIWKLQKN